MQTAACRGVQQASSLDEDGALLRTLTGREEIDEGQLLEELLREQRVLLAARNGDEGALRRLLEAEGADPPLFASAAVLATRGGHQGALRLLLLAKAKADSSRVAEAST